jgi:hypothetical protein
MEPAITVLPGFLVTGMASPGRTEDTQPGSQHNNTTRVTAKHNTTQHHTTQHHNHSHSTTQSTAQHHNHGHATTQSTAQQHNQGHSKAQHNTTTQAGSEHNTTPPPVSGTQLKVAQSTTQQITSSLRNPVLQPESIGPNPNFPGISFDARSIAIKPRPGNVRRIFALFRWDRTSRQYAVSTQTVYTITQPGSGTQLILGINRSLRPKLKCEFSVGQVCGGWLDDQNHTEFSDLYVFLPFKLSWDFA